MIDYRTALYCAVDDLLKVAGRAGECRRATRGAGVLTTVVATAGSFGVDAEAARSFMRETA